MNGPLPERVDDPDDPRLDRFRFRDRGLAMAGRGSRDAPTGLFVAEGDLVTERALAAGHELAAVLVDDRRRPSVLDLVPSDVPVYAAGERVRARVTGLGVPLEVIGLFHRPSTQPSAADVLAGSTRLVVLDAVDNPTNLGAIARTAAALGVDGLLLDPTSADPLARRAVRTSMGAVFSLRVARIAALVPDGADQLRAAGFTTVALTPDPSATALGDVDLNAPVRLALLLGSERAGLSAEVMAGADLRVRIPMRSGIDSLNVAAAAAIALYAMTAR